MSRIAIIVAMKREIDPLLSVWRRSGKKVQRGKYGAASSYQCEDTYILVGGIGSEMASMAAGYATQSIHADLIVSAGLAGATSDSLKVGDVFRPTDVVDGATGDKFATVSDGQTSGVLVSTASVLSVNEKAEIARRYVAAAVDMEAAAVAEVAQTAAVPFAAIKAISDPMDFEMPPFDRFISADGRLRTGAFLGWVATRPRYWGPMIQLARNSARAAEALAEELRRL